MAVLAVEFDFYLDFKLYIIHHSLGLPCEVKLDEMDEQVCSPRGQ